MPLDLRTSALALALALAFACGARAKAAEPVPSPAPTPAYKLVKLPNGSYTIPLRELEHSGTRGSVTLEPHGPRTIVSVYVFGSGRKHSFSLRSGADCVASRASGAVPLRPALPGAPSRTIVSLPISDLTSKNYWVDVENATAAHTFAEACASLR